MFKLPLAFYPNYQKHGVAKDAFKYAFSYKLTIKSHKKLTFVSTPPNSQISKAEEESSSGGSASSSQNVTVTCTEPSRALNLFYKTGDMRYPQLTMAKHPQHEDLVAV